MFNSVSVFAKSPGVDDTGLTCALDATAQALSCTTPAGLDLAQGEFITLQLDVTMDQFAFLRVWNRAYTFADETIGPNGTEDNVNKFQKGTGQCGDPASGFHTGSGTAADLALAESETIMGIGCNYVKKNATVAGPDFALTKTDSKDPVNVGEQFTYTLAIKHVSGGPSPQVLVTDPLPASVKFVSVTQSQGTCTHDGAAAGGLLSCDLGPMLNGSSATVGIVAEVLPGTEGTTFVNTPACVDGSFVAGSDAFVDPPGNNCDSEDTTVPGPNPVIDVELVKEREPVVSCRRGTDDVHRHGDQQGPGQRHRGCGRRQPPGRPHVRE